MKQSERYIELLKKTLINEIYIENEVKLFYLIQCLVEKCRVSNELLVNPEKMTELAQVVNDAKECGGTVTLYAKNSEGQRQPAHHLRNVLEFPHSMIGRKRMDNLHYCIETVLTDNIPGDLIETGVWRGGATILMRGVLAAHNVCDRTVWVADSFEGLPPPTLVQDQGIDLTKENFPVLSVGIDTVKGLFERYDLLDNQVKFLKGWFKDTLPKAPIEQLSVLRMDGDLYESTMDAFVSLYDKVSVGGFIIIDDYNALEVCKMAVHDFRKERHINDELIKIDTASVYWRKTKC